LNIAIYIYKGITALDAIGPYEVFSRLPDAHVYFTGEKRKSYETDTGFISLTAEYSMSDVDSAEILVIPGSTISFIKEMKKSKVLNWVKQIHETSRYTTSVCTGSLILAAADLLNGKKATSHWAASHMLKEYGAELSSDRYVHDGKIITSQGVSAGIDMALYIVKDILGEDKAKAYQLILEYFPDPPLSLLGADMADDETLKLAKEMLEKTAKDNLGFFDKVFNYGRLKKLSSGQ